MKVEELSEYLMGKDPLRIEDHWQKLYRAGFYRGGPVLMSAIGGKRIGTYHLVNGLINSGEFSFLPRSKNI